MSEFLLIEITDGLVRTFAEKTVRDLPKGMARIISPGSEEGAFLQSHLEVGYVPDPEKIDWQSAEVKKGLSWYGKRAA